MPANSDLTTRARAVLDRIADDSESEQYAEDVRAALCVVIHSRGDCNNHALTDARDLGLLKFQGGQWLSTDLGREVDRFLAEGPVK